MDARNGRPPRILVVDDDTHLLLAVKDILNDAGYETRTAADGHAAIQRISTFLPDAIVLDLMMPYVNGFEVLDWLKQQGISVPVVVATTDEDRTAAELGVVVKLAKPFTMDQLLDSLTLALGG